MDEMLLQMMDGKHNSENVNRRKCLKMIGVAGTVGAAGLSGSASAESQITKEVLTGQSKREVLNQARSTGKFHQIRKTVKKDGRFVPETTKAYKITINGETTKVALFKMERDEEEVQISVPTNDGSNQAKGIRKIYEDGEVTQFVEYGFSKGKVSKTSNEIEWTADGVPQVQAPDDVSAQGKADLTLPSWGCGTCKETVTIINGVGCAVEEAVACAVITAKTGVGPIACGVGFYVICMLVTQYGLSQPQEICEMAQAC